MSQKITMAEKRYAAVNEFANLWLEHYQRMEQGLAAPLLTPEMEQDFLKLQSRIAMRKQMLSQMMGDVFDVGNGVMNVMIKAISIDYLRQESPIMITEIKRQWNDVKTALDRILGGLREAAQAAAAKRKK